MSLDMILLGGLGGLLVLMFLLMYFKDLESSKKFGRFERAIEDLNHQNHQLKQVLASINEKEKIWLDDAKLDIHKKVQDEINTNVLPLLDSLKDIEEVLASFKNTQDERIGKLEKRAKSFDIPNDVHATNDKKVVEYYNEGKKPHEIAKALRMGLGEVEFVLKINNLL